MRKYLKDFSRTEIRDIAISYSKNPIASQCAEIHEISTDMLKKLLYKAISDCIVENDVAYAILESIKKRAIWHSKEGKEAAIYCFNKKYKQVVSARKAFMLSDEEAIRITKTYSYSSLSKKQFCFENAITCSLLDRTLLYTTCNCMVEDDIVEVLNEKALSYDSCNEFLVDELFEKIAKARRRFRQEHS